MAVIITAIFGTIYAAVQQDLRQNANDPQIQLAEDSASALASGYPADQLLAMAPKTDMSRSLYPFMFVFDNTGAMLSTTAYNGSSTLVLPPAGIFDSVRAHGEDRVTWETASGNRFAVVADAWKSNATSSDPGVATSGFILVARSLREVEARENQAARLAFAGWAISIIASLIGVWLKKRSA